MPVQGMSESCAFSNPRQWNYSAWTGLLLWAYGTAEIVDRCRCAQRRLRENSWEMRVSKRGTDPTGQDGKHMVWLLSLRDFKIRLSKLHELRVGHQPLTWLMLFCIIELSYQQERIFTSAQIIFLKYPLSVYYWHIQKKFPFYKKE